MIPGIAVGDTVMVTWPGHCQVQGTVGYVPTASGEAWRLVGDHGEVLYVQQYGLMRLLKRREEVPAC